MDSELERTLRALKEANAGRSLDGIEGAVWRTIESERARHARAFVLVPIQGIAVCLALGVGVLIGHATAATHAQDLSEISALSVQPALAPSTLLGARE